MAKREYLLAVSGRYRESTKQEKKHILDEVCKTSGFHRKSAIRALRRVHRDQVPRSGRGRPAIYDGSLVLGPLKKLWFASNQPCSRRLKVMLPLWIEGYEASRGPFPELVKSQLLALSASTIDRLLRPTRLLVQRRGRCTTKPGTLLRRNIPVNTDQWNEERPGFVEADTVAHCGGSMLGQFAYTLNCVDIATGWTEQRAVWSKRKSDVVTQMRSIEKNLPFQLLGFDSDNGSEFINHELIKHFFSREKSVKFTRSRPYHKNDNAHVEQKNWTHVRQWIGYQRLDNPEVITRLNELYLGAWRILHNFYMPSFKLIKKERVGSKIVKKHDTPKTPHQRMMESDYVSEHQKQKLQAILKSTNPFELRDQIDAQLKRVFDTCDMNPSQEAS